MVPAPMSQRQASGSEQERRLAARRAEAQVGDHGDDGAGAAQTPSTAAMIGLGQARMAFTRSRSCA